MTVPQRNYLDQLRTRLRQASSDDSIYERFRLIEDALCEVIDVLIGTSEEAAR